MFHVFVFICQKTKRKYIYIYKKEDKEKLKSSTFYVWQVGRHKTSHEPTHIFFYLNRMVMALPNLGSFSNPTATASAAGSPSASNPLSPSDDPSKKIRKPYTITKSRESWTEPEHDKFLEALQLWVLKLGTISTANSLWFRAKGLIWVERREDIF